MDFQGYLEKSYQLLTEEPLILIGGGVLLSLLVSLSVGILSGPLFGAYMLMIIARLRDGRAMAFNDLFAGLSRFGELFPLIALGLLIGLGFFLFIIPGVLFATWWLYTLPLMADRRLSLGEAMRISKARVSDQGFFAHLVFILLVTVVPTLLIEVAAAIFAPLGLLGLVLLPFQAGCLACLYLDQFGESTAHQGDSGQDAPLEPPTASDTAGPITPPPVPFLAGAAI